jgi:exodeoxyribonuclease VII small subunit
MTLEQKLLRLQEIQQLLEQKKVTLSESMPLLEEAYKLKKEIEDEINQMENRLTQITQQAEE